MKKKSILSLVTLLCVASSVTAFATEKIPSHMNPGTVIQYDSNKEMKVLKKGSTSTNEKSIENAQSIENDKGSNDIPEIKDGMTVIYDALGGPVVVGNSDSNIDKNSESNQDDNGIEAYSSNQQQGYVSWYNIWGGSNTASGTRAANGAAHKTIAFYTKVTVCNEEDNYNSTVVQILDRGPYVSGRILDMSKESFSNIANTNDGTFYGALYW